MKVIAVVGSNKQGREAVKEGLSHELGYDGYSVIEDLREYLTKDGLNSDRSKESIDEMATVIAKVSGVVETRLIAKIFDNAAKGRWGFVVTDILEQKTVELIAHLGGQIVFVGNDTENSKTLEVDNDHDVNLVIEDSNYLKTDIRDNLLDIPVILEGLSKKTIREAIVIHQEMVQDLTASGFDVLSK